MASRNIATPTAKMPTPRRRINASPSAERRGGKGTPIAGEGSSGAARGAGAAAARFWSTDLITSASSAAERGTVRPDCIGTARPSRSSWLHGIAASCSAGGVGRGGFTVCAAAAASAARSGALPIAAFAFAIAFAFAVAK